MAEYRAYRFKRRKKPFNFTGALSALYTVKSNISKLEIRNIHAIPKSDEDQL